MRHVAVILRGTYKVEAQRRDGKSLFSFKSVRALNACPVLLCSWLNCLRQWGITIDFIRFNAPLSHCFITRTFFHNSLLFLCFAKIFSRLLTNYKIEIISLDGTRLSISVARIPNSARSLKDGCVNQSRSDSARSDDSLSMKNHLATNVCRERINFFFQSVVAFRKFITEKSNPNSRKANQLSWDNNRK